MITKVMLVTGCSSGIDVVVQAGLVQSNVAANAIAGSDLPRFARGAVFTRYSGLPTLRIG